MSDFGIVLTAAEILYNQIEQHLSNKGQYKLLGDRVRTLLHRRPEEVQHQPLPLFPSWPDPNQSELLPPAALNP